MGPIFFSMGPILNMIRGLSWQSPRRPSFFSQKWPWSAPHSYPTTGGGNFRPRSRVRIFFSQHATPVRVGPSLLWRIMTLRLRRHDAALTSRPDRRRHCWSGDVLDSTFRPGNGARWPRRRSRSAAATARAPPSLSPAISAAATIAGSPGGASRRDRPASAAWETHNDQCRRRGRSAPAIASALGGGT